ncbi:MAG TPA: ABC transporter permease subunit [Anaerolineaceae bacterium]|nr:ABC transporter permease subunit [Anaerolineaceae bacterium]
MDPSAFDNLLVAASDALRRGERTEARRLAFLAMRLDPANEKPWLILAFAATPVASHFYFQKARECNLHCEAAQKGILWAEESQRLSFNDAPTRPVRIILNPPQRSNGKPLPPIEVAPTNREPDRLAMDPSMEKTQPIAVRRKPPGHGWQFFGLAKAAWPNLEKTPTGALSRIAKYAGVRAAALFASVVVSIFLIVTIANLGGYLDTIQRGLINEDINAMLMSGWLRDETQEVREASIAETRAQMESFYELDKPYLQRTLNWMYRGITFDWGRAKFDYPLSTTYWQETRVGEITSKDIRTLVQVYLPRTLLLLGVSNLGIFLITVLIALPLARKPESWPDRLIRWLAPTSSIPSWFFGLIFLAIVIKVFGNYSYRLGFNDWRSQLDITFLPTILKGLALPFLAIFISKFFQCVYSWRNYFLMYSKEDYVELGRAKGLPDQALERRYLLRPALPAILTSFVLIVIGLWQECIAIEYFFNIGGVGGLFKSALDNNDITVVVALVAMFAYFLAVTVFILDILYVLIDPRVRIGNEKQNERPIRGQRGFRFSLTPRLSSPSGLKIARPASLKPWFASQRASARQQIAEFQRGFAGFRRDIRAYPTASIGITIILILTLISIVTVIAIPYKRAISLWRGDDKAYYRNPKLAPPAWTNFFRQEKLPENIDLNSQNDPTLKAIRPVKGATSSITLTFPFEYGYHSLPQDVLVLFYPRFQEKKPYVSLTWVTPDGREIRLNRFAAGHDSTYVFSQDRHLGVVFKGKPVLPAAFSGPGSRPGEVLPGRYELKVEGILFEEQSDLDAEVVVYGQVYGVAGTDLYRRDLSLILLWGLAVALFFGIAAALVTTLGSVTLAAAGVWFGGWIDGLLQRISEINMVLPVLPTSIMIFFLYSKSFWVILGVTIGLSIFGNAIKNYRAMFLQVIQLPYIEAARSYGASGWRIILRYMVPRIRNVIIPQLIILIPTYIFFEATLTFLGVSDPVLPTLGKLLYMIANGGLTVMPMYIMVEAAVVLVLISIGFALFGFALERMFNERLGV